MNCTSTSVAAAMTTPDRNVAEGLMASHKIPPTMGTIRAETPPIVVITSNRTREIHDAVKRRCIYHWIDYPTVEREVAILHKKAPGTPDALSRELAAAMHKLRNLDLFKAPGVAETVDWAKALQVLGEVELSPEAVDATLGVIVKYEEDLQAVRDAGVESLI